MKRGVVWSFVALLLPVASAAAEVTRSYVLPTVPCKDFFLVQMQVSGDPDRVLSMVLDTGASYTVIDTEAAARVAGKPIPDGQRARFGELVAGELKFGGLRAKVMQLDHLQRAFSVPMDGILGFPTFADMLLTIDYPAGEVRVREGRLPAPDGVRILRTVKEKRRPLIEVDFGGGNRTVLLDSGSYSGLLLREARGLDLADPPVVYDSSLRIDRVMMRSGGRLAGSVVFGGATLNRPTVDFGNSINLVGAGLMRHFVATFDQKRRRVLFERAETEPIEFPAVRDTGWAVRPGESGFEVLRVFEGFGAERAGLRPGDVILAVDGTPVYERDFCEARPEQPDAVTVTVERDGKQLDLRIEIDTVVP